MTPKKPTRDDVAALAGTSAAVVSYVVNSGPRNVSPERRKRVLEAMLELNYYPNAHARSLRSTETRTLGMIVPNISNAYFAEFALAVEDAAISKGRLVFLGNSSENPEREQAYISSFLEQQVDGIIFIGIAMKPSVGRIVQAGMPLVLVDRVIHDSNVPTIAMSHRAAARTATQHLLEHGHRSIACLTGPKTIAVAEDRRLGWQDALREAEVDPNQQQAIRSPFTVEGGIASLSRLITGSGQLPPALFAASDEQARGIILAATQRGLSVPHDLAIVSVDGTREGRYSHPGLTTVRQPFRELAEAAVASVLAPRGTPLAHVELAGSLIVRSSCGCEAGDPRRVARRVSRPGKG